MQFYSKPDNLTQDTKIRKSDQYQRIETVIDQIFNTGVLQHAAGNCIALSEMLQHLLAENFVSSRLVECKVMVTESRDGFLTDFKYVGWDGGRYNRVPDAVDTHVIVVTEGETPILIDLSIPHVLTMPRVMICEPVNSLDPDVIAEYRWGNRKVRYDIKKNPRLLGLHQTTLLDRLRIESENKRRMNTLQIVVAVLTVATMVNLMLNTSQLLFRTELIDTLDKLEYRYSSPK